MHLFFNSGADVNQALSYLTDYTRNCLFASNSLQANTPKFACISYLPSTATKRRSASLRFETDILSTQIQCLRNCWSKRTGTSPQHICRLLQCVPCLSLSTFPRPNAQFYFINKGAVQRTFRTYKSICLSRVHVLNR